MEKILVMNTSHKRFLAFLLSFLLIIGLTPLNANAAPLEPNYEISDIGTSPVTTVPASLTNGQIWTDKSVTYAGNGEFDITLKAAAQDFKSVTTSAAANVDVILALDFSQSMDQTKIKNMTTAAINAVNKILEVPGNRVAIIKYSDGATWVQDFSTNANTLKNQINANYSQGYTNIQAAIRMAQSEFQDRSDTSRTPVLIILSDGWPTKWYELRTNGNTSGSLQSNINDNNYQGVYWTVEQARLTKAAIPTLKIYTLGFGVGTLNASQQSMANATLIPDQTNTQSFWNGFNPDKTWQTGHKYWESGSTVLGESGSNAMVTALTAIISSATGQKPLSYHVNGTVNYTDIAITDVLGTGFEISGALPAGLSQNDNTITWTIDGDDMLTMPYDSTTLDAAKILTKTFRVKINQSVGAGQYFTNSSAKAEFNVSTENPFYSGTIILEPLNNKGWLTLVSNDVATTITISKEVTGPASGNRTFVFNLYRSNETSETPLNATPIAITVNGSGTEQTSFNLTLTASDFANNTVQLYAKEDSTTQDAYWDYDNENRKAFTVTKSGSAATGTVSFLNEYDPKGTLTVEKKWTGNGPTTPVAIKLKKQIGTDPWEYVGEAVTLNAENNWTTTFTDLELGVTYGVEETSSVLDYAAPTYSPNTVVFTAEDLDKQIEITNGYVTPKGTITINKAWDDNSNSAGDRPDQIQYQYTGPINPATEQQITGTLTLTSNGAVNNTWTKDLEIYAFGNYTFTEIVPADYQVAEGSLTASTSLMPVGDRAKSLTFTNTYIPPTGSLTVTKEWAGEGSDISYRPQSITLEIFKDSATVPAMTLNLPENDGTPWSHEYTGLEFGSYTVKEITVPDYTVTYSSETVELTKADRTDGITITNTFDNPKGSISVSKTWVEDDAVPANTRPSQITVSLMDGDDVVSSAAISGNGNSWNHTFGNLPLNGTTYTVIESAAGEDATKLANYNQGIIYDSNVSSTGITLNHNNRSGSAALLNTYAMGTITVVKTWANEDVSNYPEGDRPTTFTVKLYKQVAVIIPVMKLVDSTNASGEAIQIEVQDGTKTEISSTLVETRTITRPNSTVVFYDLEIEDGASYFVVEEDDIPFYTTVYSTNEMIELSQETPNQWIGITNTYQDPRGSLTVTKSWNHGNNPNHPDSVTVNLMANAVKIATQTLDGAHDWTWTFQGLTLGAIYTIEEVQVSNYSTAGDTDFSYTPVKDNGAVASASLTIRNSYVPETGTVTVEKQWEGTTGGAIMVSLYRAVGDATPTIVGTTTLSAVNNWMDNFTGLELYGPGERPYIYSATESGDLTLYTKNTPANTVQLNDEASDTITFINTYAPRQGTLIVTKQWFGDNERPIDAPTDSVSFWLVTDGDKSQGTYTLNAENNWTMEFSGLDVDQVYSVEEKDPLQEFHVSYSPNDVRFNSQDLEEAINIINTRTSDNPSITATKSALETNAVLVDGKATFHYTVEIANDGNRTLNNIKVTDKMTAPEGATIVYGPTPAAINGDGSVEFQLSGNLLPGANNSIHYAVTVDKAGSYNNLATVRAYYGETAYEDSDEATVTVKAPGLSIIKNVIGSSIKTGDGGTFDYELRVRNDGQVDLHDVKIVDSFTSASGLTVSYSNISGVTFDPATRTFDVGHLTSSAVDLIITYSVTVNQRGTFGNLATINGYYEDWNNMIETGDDERTQPAKVWLSDSDDASVTVAAPYNPPNNDDDDDTPTPPVNVPTEPTPLSPTPEAPIVLVEEDTPLADLPKTGEEDPALLYGLGALLIAGGILIRRRKDAEN